MGPSRREPLPDAEVIWEDDRRPSPLAEEPGPGARSTTAAVGLGVVVVIAALTTWVLGDSTPAADSPPDALAGELDREEQVVAESLPVELVAAELYAASPGPTTLRALLEAIGGVEGLVLGRAEGAFDLVTFDPNDPDHLLASTRSSYGPAENQEANEEWQVARGSVSQNLFAPDVAHDVAHFNNDGTVAIWSNSGNSVDFASRTVTLESGTSVLASDPVYASRSAIADGALFALTGSEDYYSSNLKFESLIADRGGRQTVLDTGDAYSWVDSPAPGVVIAYPVDDLDSTAVWDASSLERIPDHPLAGLPHRRIAVSGDGTVAVGVTGNGQLEVVDPKTGSVGARFGSLNPDGIAQPVTLSHDGTLAITVDRDGTVALWWVGESRPIALIEADAGPARVLTERRAPRTSSAVDPTARRVAVRQTAIATTPTTWTIIDTDPESWIDRACRIVGRPLTANERSGLGLSSDSSDNSGCG